MNEASSTAWGSEVYASTRKLIVVSRVAIGLAVPLFAVVSLVPTASGNVDGGLSHTPSDSSTPRPSDTPPARGGDLGDLERDIAELSKDVNGARPKDNWDRLAAISGLASGLAVAVIGVFATRAFNRRQEAAEDKRKEQDVRVQELQAVPALFPHLLSKNEDEKQLALLTLKELGSARIASVLALRVGGAGAVGALSKIAATESPDEARLAESALGSLFEALHGAVVQVRSAQPTSVASGLIVDTTGLVVTTAYAATGKSVSVALSDGSVYPARPLTVDEPSEDTSRISSGLALLQIVGDGVTFNAYPLEAMEPPEWGDELVIFRFSQAEWRGTVTTVRSVAPSFQMTPSVQLGEVILTSAEISAPGDGGAPVVDREGRIAGLVYAGASGQYTLLIAASTIRDFVVAHSA